MEDIEVERGKFCKQVSKREKVTQQSRLPQKILYLRQQLISVRSRRNFLVFLLGILQKNKQLNLIFNAIG